MMEKTKVSELLEKIKKRQISAEEGLKLFKGMDNTNQHKECGAIHFQLDWHRADLQKNQNVPPLKGNLLIFDNDEVLANKFKNLDNSVALQVVVVLSGDGFEKVHENIYRINPSREDDYRALLEALGKGQFTPDWILYNWYEEEFKRDSSGLQRQLEKSIYSLFFLSKGLMAQKLKNKIKLIYLHASQMQGKINPLYGGLRGFAKTINMENPFFIYKSLYFNGEVSKKGDLVEAIKGEFLYGNDGDLEVKVENNCRYVKSFSEYKGTTNSEVMQIREKGVYLITGGAGGLGLIFADYLIKNYQANVVLTGRSDLKEDKKERLDKLEAQGGKVVYIKADVSLQKDVEVMVSEIKSTFGVINGVIHAAGLYRNGFILKKSQGDMEAVFAPKIAGTLYLDEALQEEKLDFFAMFSSIASVIGKVGQCDYAYANSFMDYFSEYRRQLRTEGKRFGKSISLNWPYWQEGGMQISKDEKEYYSQHVGIEALPTKDGINAFMMSGEYNDHCAVIYGDKEKINSFTNNSQPQEFAGLEEEAKIDPSHLQEKTEEMLKVLIAAEIGLPVDKIGAKVTFEEYGIDSIVINHFNAEIEEKLGPLPKTLLFEYNNIHDLAGYLVNSYYDKLIEVLNLTSKVEKKLKGIIKQEVKPKINQEVEKEKTIEKKTTIEKTIAVDETVIREKTEALLKSLISAEIGLPVDKIGAKVTFEEYGIDSIVINHFNAEIEKKLGPLPKTLLFEYNNIYDLAGYLVENFNDQLMKVLGLQRQQPQKISKNLKNQDKQNQEILSSKNPIKETKVREIRRSSSSSRFPREDGNRDNQEETPISKITTNYTEEDIAIIGMNGQYPLARNLDEYWKNLQEGRDCITEIPASRWDSSKYKMYCNWGGFIDDIDKFDPLFFNISPIEAEIIDPQERIFLQTAWWALEDAGYTRKELIEFVNHQKAANVGVFVGVTTNTYQLLGVEESLRGNNVTVNSSPWSVANRVSYLLNFNGPSVPVDTACSSGLTAIHFAVESLKRRECKVAIVGGVNLYLHPSKYQGMCEMKMLSPKGRCHTFGAKADGFVPSEGVGALVLKPLSQAKKDKDHIYAVIKGSAINHGGTTNGYTVPNLNAQADLIAKAIENSGVDARSISFIEAHGTGTKLGDPIEIAGLTKTFHNYTKEKHFCAISSSKSNIGHCESAAGIAGIHKIILQMQNKQLVPSIHTEDLNENIDFSNSPFIVQRELKQWQRPVMMDEYGQKMEYPRRAGISSFGAGGANAHVILEEYVEQEAIGFDGENSQQLFVLSAKNKERLQEYVAKFVGFLKEKRESSSLQNINSPLLETVYDDVVFITKQGNLIEDEIVDRYTAAFKTIEEFIPYLVLMAFRDMGVFKKTQEEYPRKDLRDNTLQITTFNHRLYEVLLDILQENQFIKADDNRVVTTEAIESKETVEKLKNIELIKNKIGEDYPEVAAHVNLLWVCVTEFSSVLTGKKKQTDVLFPNGSMKLVEKIYKGNISDYFNTVTAKTIKSYIQQRIKENPASKVRILEIGAGTGGTSGFIFEEIQEYGNNVEYVYTDISLGFTQFGKRTYGTKYPFIDFRVLNIEKDPIDQNLSKESFDIAFGTNVIHATSNITNSLTNIKKLLKPYGLFMVNESIRRLDFSTLTFGLTEGWWLFNDGDVRIKNSPLLSVDHWKNVFSSVGFKNIRNIGLPKKSDFESGQNLIIGEFIPDVPMEDEEKRININLSKLAYTLQVGREPMEERLALVVETPEELLEKLEAYGEGNKSISKLYQGNVKANKIQSEILIDGEEGREFIQNIIRNRRFAKLAQLWTAGIDIDWRLLHDGEGVGRMPLPTYPFEKERCWISTSHEKNIINNGCEVSRLHPFIDTNESWLEELAFKKTIKGDGKITLPDSFYLEMALAAGNLAGKGRQVTAIENIEFFTSTEVVEDDQDLYIGLYPDGQLEEVEYEVYSREEDRRVYARGVLIYDDFQGDEYIDIGAIKARCGNTIDAEAFYNNLKAEGVAIGNHNQIVEEYRGNGVEALLKFNEEKLNQIHDGILSPSIFEGVLQGMIILTGQMEYLYSIQRITVQEELASSSYAHIVLLEQQQQGENRYVISITEENGGVLAVLEGVITGTNPFEDLEEKRLMGLLMELESGKIDIGEVDKLTEEILNG